MALGEVSHSIVELGMLDENSAEGEDIATGELIESGRSWSVVLRELTAERRLFPLGCLCFVFSRLSLFCCFCRLLHWHWREENYVLQNTTLHSVELCSQRCRSCPSRWQ